MGTRDRYFRQTRIDLMITSPIHCWLGGWLVYYDTV